MKRFQYHPNKTHSQEQALCHRRCRRLRRIPLVRNGGIRLLFYDVVVDIDPLPVRSQGTDPGIVEYVNIVLVSDDASVKIMDTALQSGAGGQAHDHQEQHSNCQCFLHDSFLRNPVSVYHYNPGILKTQEKCRNDPMNLPEEQRTPGKTQRTRVFQERL